MIDPELGFHEVPMTTLLGKQDPRFSATHLVDFQDLCDRFLDTTILLFDCSNDQIKPYARVR